MATVDVPLERIRFGKTQRRDLWWAMPLTTFIVFSSFIVYVTWALFQGEHYHYGNYLSPLYSPELFGNSPHAVFGEVPAWLAGLFEPLAIAGVMIDVTTSVLGASSDGSLSTSV